MPTFAAAILLALAASLDSGPPALAQDKQEAHWRLDGDARDAGPGALHGRIAGRADFIDSPVGGAGQALVLNGVDTVVELATPAAEFTLSAWILPLEIKPRTLVSRGWTLGLGDRGQLQWQGRDVAAASLRANLWHHLAIVVKQGEASVYVNGSAALSGAAAGTPGGPITIGKGVDGKFFYGLLDDVRLGSSARGAEEIVRLVDDGLPWARLRPHARTPFPGRFVLEDGDSVVFAGGENVLGAQETGHLETLLTVAEAGKRVLFRTMAWEGDTADDQWRLLNFASWEEQFDRVGASVIVAQFGQMEALRGKNGLAEFRAALGKLLDRFGARTRRIVLLSPTPFERPDPPVPDLSVRNDDLALYVDSLRGAAKEREILFVDLFTPMRSAGTRLTRDGIHLTADGHARVARETARQLGLDAPAERPALERIRAAIVRKNRLWLDHWRPPNWAFTASDRIEQPYGKDPRDGRVRALPIDVQRFPALIRREEAEIEKLVPKAVEP